MTLTPAGAGEMARLRQIGVDRFAEFVAGWEPGEVRTLTALLEKLHSSKTTPAAPPPRPGRRRWARQDA